MSWERINLTHSDFQSCEHDISISNWDFIKRNHDTNHSVNIRTLREIFNWVAINVQENYLKVKFDTNEFFVLNDIVESVLKSSKIKLNLFQRNNINEEKLETSMTSNREMNAKSENHQNDVAEFNNEKKIFKLIEIIFKNKNAVDQKITAAWKKTVVDKKAKVAAIKKIKANILQSNDKDFVNLKIFNDFASYFAKHLNIKNFKFFSKNFVIFDVWFFYIVKISAKKRRNIFSKNFNFKKDIRTNKYDFEKTIKISDKKKIFRYSIILNNLQLLNFKET